MEFRGFKIDLLGLAAVITAIGAFWTGYKANRNKEKSDARKTDSFKPFV
jgi:hypothetical protein